MSCKEVFMSYMLVLSLFFSTSAIEGAFAPWASDTDPADVPRSHVQNITTSPFTYSITQGGTMDGKMCTTLPGVLEPYEQTWESNRSIRTENIGTSNIINPWLKIGPIDFFSQQTIANSVVDGLSTDREKALAIFYFYINHRFHKGNGDNTDVVFRWSTVKDPDGDAITDYHFQLSDPPDIRWPMSPNFDKYISKTPDTGNVRYTLPHPGQPRTTANNDHFISALRYKDHPHDYHR